VTPPFDTIREALKPLANNSGVRKALATLAQLEAMVGEQEPVHWRAVLDPEQAPQQLKTTMHVVGFREKKAAEGFVAEQIDFYGWRYTIEPLYAAPVAQQYEAGDVASAAAQGFRDGVASVTQQPQKLEDVEQYRMQMAGISTAAMGYWKEGDSIHPDYDTPALRDVAKLYAKYDALYKAQQPQAKPHKPLFADLIAQHPGLREELLEMDKQPQAKQPQADTPQATTIAEAARDVGKWLNECPNRPIDLRHVAMLVAHAMQPQAEHDLDVVWKLHGPDN